jgi:non-canonical (house-cleaning) NTP pyrophosphatase
MQAETKVIDHSDKSHKYRFVVTSASDIKVKTVADFITKNYPTIKVSSVEGFNCNKAPNPEQPINSAQQCAINRLEYCQKNIGAYDSNFTVFVSVENGIELEGGPLDVSHVVISHAGRYFKGQSFGIFFPEHYLEKAREQSKADYEHAKLGISKTVGEVINKLHPEIPKNNWMKDMRFGG